MIVGIFFLTLIVLMLLGVPVAYALGISSAGYMLATGTSLAMIAQRMVNGANSFTMLAIPFFFMAGELMNISGVTDKIIIMAKALVGHMKGGLAQVNIVASVFFAGVSGSATADTAALGSSLIPAMVKEGYDLDFSAAITVASSCVGPIIPPSITLVLYGILSGTDVARLLIAGILPGIVVAGTQMIYTHFYSIKMDYPSYPKATPKEMGKAVTTGFSALMMPIIIIGGTMTGVFTPTESAAIAVLYGIIIGFFLYRNITIPQFYNSLKKVGVASMNNMFILAAASCFSWVLTMSKAPDMLVEVMLGISTNKYVLICMILVLLIFIGFFMQASQALVVLTPILMPVIEAIGVDPIHFGLIMVVTLTFGGCTPPVGSMLFVVNSITRMGFARLTKAMLPLYIPLIAAILIITFIPQVSLFLPNLIFG
ncbi:TRAP transporter large permease [Flavonifractor sp. An100]|uniref:TRAP transporter large permease n=1 Tax=Flavonifractor sp. An100 TaxID=1965538 RepID=UPI000B3A849D|nr:TRAP transporter large permease [Flavonifractor sp. An100]OUQ77918.1 transporter [Flavonifractor sp. An100]